MLLTTLAGMALVVATALLLLKRRRENSRTAAPSRATSRLQSEQLTHVATTGSSAAPADSPIEGPEAGKGAYHELTHEQLKEVSRLVGLGQQMETHWEPHAQTLMRRRKQLRVPDAYGVIDNTSWNRELEHVFTNVVWPGLQMEVPRLLTSVTEAFDGFVTDVNRSCDELEIDERFALEDEDFEDFDVDTMDPLAFEDLCATRLQVLGWNTRRTARTGDQGIDIIAERDGMRYVIQCKRYGSPVGNKAVQEALAGMAFERADACAVVTNADFTPSARQLAQSAGVTLLHWTDLDQLGDD